jgi:multiple sugar transport system permease protein
MTDAAHAAGPVRGRALPSLAWHIVLCTASLAMLYPLIWMLASSFKPEDEIFSSASLWPSLQSRGTPAAGPACR